MRASLRFKPSNPRPWRLPKRYALTIIAGFKCYEGIVICSDTQEGIEGSPSKRNVPKLRFEPSDEDHSMGDTLAAAFCGSGQGPFIDKLIENAWQEAQLATNLDEACTEIEKSIKATYKEFGEIFQPGYCPTVQLIYGVKMHDGTRLFSAHGPVVNEKTGYDSSGAGYYMADFLAARMYRQQLTLHQCVILAAYILFQAKEHVEGCGGDSHIAVLRNDGTSGIVKTERIEAITKLLQFADYESGNFILETANLDVDKNEFKKNVDLIVDLMGTIREGRRSELIQRQNQSAMLYGAFTGGANPEPTDSFGLPMPSGSQKLKGQR